MNLRRLPAAALAAALLSAGCTPVQTTPLPGPAAAAAAADLSGTYRFSTEAMDQQFQGEIRLAAGAGGGYTGVVTTPLTGDLAVQTVISSGNDLRITARGSEGDALLNLEFSGPHFVGMWSYATATGAMAGSQLSGPGLAARGTLPAAGEPGAEYVGSYLIPGMNLRVDFRREGSHLVSQAQGQASFPLLYLGQHRFRSPTPMGIAVEFHVADGRATAFTLTQGGQSIRVPRVQ
jgi:hypothetical protein